MNKKFLKLLTIACIISTPTTVIIADNNSYNSQEVSKEAKFADKLSLLLENRVKSEGKDIAQLYKTLYYLPVWIGDKAPTKFAKQLFKHIDSDRSVSDILEIQQAYKRAKEAIERAYQANSSIKDKLNAELAVSNLYLTYLNYLLYGGIDWQAFDKKKAQLSRIYNAQVGWDRYKPKYTPASLLSDAVLADDFQSLFKKAEPKRFKYAQLKDYLLKYIDIRDNGGWDRLPKYRYIKPYRKSSAIPLIRRHLQLTQDLKSSDNNDSRIYDKALQKAIIRYKLRHGLRGNKRIDRETWKLLNEPVDNLIAKIRLNLDRIKWIYHQEAPVRIELNIPAFRLYFYDGKELVNTMRVVTGKPNHPTPSFHNTMKYIVVNPYWKIPQSIVKQEMLQHLIKNPYYYESRGKHLHATWDENSPLIDPGSVDWKQYRGSKPIPYYFMQDPGTSNALGKIKFLFPNKYSVYIHDTPSKKLFFRNIRAFSHGCMRIQKPKEMLKTLSLFNDNIDVEELMALLKTKRKKTVVLKNKIPVDIVYLTAFVDDYGNLNFRKDIYNYDKYQLKHYKYHTFRVKRSKKVQKVITKKSSNLDLNMTEPKSDNNITSIDSNRSDNNSTLLDNKSVTIDNNRTKKIKKVAKKDKIVDKNATKKLMKVLDDDF